MRLTFQFVIFGHALEVGFGRHEEEQPEEHISLTGDPIGFALPDDSPDEGDEPSPFTLGVS